MFPMLLFQKLSSMLITGQSVSAKSYIGSMGIPKNGVVTLYSTLQCTISSPWMWAKKSFAG